MFEQDFLNFIQEKCAGIINIYFLNSPKNKKTPYSVLYPASASFENAGGEAERVETIYRLDIYDLNKKDTLYAGYEIKKAIDKYRGSIGNFKDTFIRCQNPNILTFGDGTYKVLLEIDIQYITNGGQL